MLVTFDPLDSSVLVLALASEDLLLELVASPGKRFRTLPDSARILCAILWMHLGTDLCRFVTSGRS